MEWNRDRQVGTVSFPPSSDVARHDEGEVVKRVCHRLVVEHLLDGTGRPVCFHEDTEYFRLLVLNRPQRCNAFSREMLVLLREELQALERSPEIPAVLITGMGRAFCSGLDLAEAMSPGTPGQTPPGLEMVRLVVEVLGLLYRIPQCIYTVGWRVARGGGAALLLLGDCVTVDPSFTLAFPEVKLGFKPCLLHPFLSRILKGNVYEQLQKGNPMTAQEAQAAGLLQVDTSDMFLESGLASAWMHSMKSQEKAGVVSRVKPERIPLPPKELAEAVAQHWSSWCGEQAQHKIREFLDGKR